MTRRGASDPNEVRPSMGPLFEAPRLRNLSHASDPHTSVKAAAKAVREGEINRGQKVALAFVENNPGSTAKELARAAMAAYGGQYGAEWWRQRIGRRLSELLTAGLVHRAGERDGCALWWPGRDPKKEDR